MVTEHERANAIKLINEMREKEGVGRNKTRGVQHIAELFDNAQREPSAEIELPPPNVQPLTIDDIRRREDIPVLEDMYAAPHLSGAKRERYQSFLDTIRSIRQDWKQGDWLILTSVEGGYGKTMIADALLSTFWNYIRPADPEIDCFALIDGYPNYSVDKVGTARIDAATAHLYASGSQRDEPNSITDLIPPKCKIVMIDDVGKEGALRFVATADQAIEKQSRYFQIFNHCCREAKNISGILTTNLPLPALIELIGSHSWSRLQDMAPKGRVFDMQNYADYRQWRSGRG